MEGSSLYLLDICEKIENMTQNGGCSCNRKKTENRVNTAKLLLRFGLSKLYFKGLYNLQYYL